MVDTSPVRVVLRCRPPLPAEEHFSPHLRPGHADNTVVVGRTSGAVDFASREFAFDTVYGSDFTQPTFYLNEVSPTVRSVSAGSSAAIVVCGAALAGKQYTAVGDPDRADERGIVCSAAEELVGEASRAPKGSEHLVTLTALYVVQDSVFDLLRAPERGRRPQALRLNDAPVTASRPFSILIPEATEVAFESQAHLGDIIGAASSAAANFSLVPSRPGRPRGRTVGHVVYNLSYYRRGSTPSRLSIAVLSDWDPSATSGAGWSWAALSAVLREKVRNKHRADAQHVPYRNSKLTQLLRDALQSPEATATVIGCVSGTPPSSYEATNGVCKALFRLRQEVLGAAQRTLSASRVLYSSQVATPGHYTGPAGEEHPGEFDSAASRVSQLLSGNTTHGPANSEATERLGQRGSALSMSALNAGRKAPPQPRSAPVSTPRAAGSGYTSRDGFPTRAANFTGAADETKILATELADTRSDLAVRNDMVRQLESELKTANEELRTLRQRLGQHGNLVTEADGLRRSVMSSEAEAARAEAALAMTRGERDEALARCQALEERCLLAETESRETYRRVNTLEAQSAAAGETAQQLREELARTQARVRTEAERHENTKQRLTEALDDIAETQRMATAATTQLEARRENHAEVEARASEEQEKRLALEAERDEMKTQMDSLRHELTSALDSVESLKERLDAEVARTASQAQRLEAHDARITRLRAELRESRENARLATRENERLGAENAALRRQTADAEQSALLAGDKVARLEADLTAAEDHAAKEQSRAQGLESDVTRLRTEVDNGIAARGAAEARNRALSEELGVIQASYKRTVRDNDAQREAAARLRAHLHEVESDRDNARHVQSEERDARRAAEFEVEQMTEHVESCGRRISSLNEDNRSLNRRLHGAELRTTTLEGVVDDQRKTTDAILENRKHLIARAERLREHTGEEREKWNTLSEDATRSVANELAEEEQGETQPEALVASTAPTRGVFGKQTAGVYASPE